MTLGRFAILFVLGLVAAIAFKLTWLYWLLAAPLVAVLLKLRVKGLDGVPRARYFRLGQARCPHGLLLAHSVAICLNKTPHSVSGLATQALQFALLMTDPSK
uniref:hypothetical protein n=1 Tax=Cyanobium sp. TaxID=2164130 RepID=UPI004048E864